MPIEATNGFSSECPANAEPSGMLRPIFARRSASGFSSNPAICPFRSKRKMPISDADDVGTGCAAIVMSAFRSTCESITSAKSIR